MSEFYNNDDLSAHTIEESDTMIVKINNNKLVMQTINPFSKCHVCKKNTSKLDDDEEFLFINREDDIRIICSTCYPSRKNGLQQEGWKYGCSCIIIDESETESDNEYIDMKSDDSNCYLEKEDIKLCHNQDCTEKPIHNMLSEKCKICDGYFVDEGLNDIYYLEENGEKGCCELCGKTTNICIMKGSGQEICINACDESDESDN